jgi:hypothetical protein
LALGCAAPQSTESGQAPFQPVLADLHPGTYCRVEMRVPPMAESGSYQRYTGCVQQVSDDAIVLVETIEESHVAFGIRTQKRDAYARARGTIRIPITGIADMQIVDPPQKSKSAPAEVAADSPASRPGGKAVPPEK